MRRAKFWTFLGVFAGVGVVQGQIVNQSTNYSINLTIPDNNPNGLASTRTFSSSIVSLSNLAVTLNISGSWNGDLYGYLVHNSGFAVLLNRVGRSASAPFGYSDAGFNVTLDDQSAGSDIHTYRAALGGGLLTTPLTGTWLSDARFIDPALSDVSTPRTATLATFNGLNASGDWTLFLADLSAGNQGVLVSWGLQAQGVVPEPGAGLLFLAGVPALWWMLRRRTPHF